MAASIPPTSDNRIDSAGSHRIEWMPIGVLRPNPRNARTHSQKQIRQIAASIRKFGFLNPVLVDDTNMTAAGETLPEWRGQPETAHWRYADPIKAEGTELERRRPFVLILSGLERQLQIFMQLPFASLDHMALKARLDELGRSGS
jgi:hypothetical protein